MKQVVLFFVIVFSYNFKAYSQQKIKELHPTAIKKYEMALSEIEKENFVLASSFLKEALEIEPLYTEAMIASAHIQFVKKKYENAVEIYYDLYKKNPLANFQYRYEYSVALAGLGRFVEALDQINLYLAQPNLPQEVIEKGTKVKANYQFALKYESENKTLLSNYKFIPQNLGESVNSKYSEYFPTLTFDAKKIIFTRRVNHNNEDFYESELIDSSWGVATPIRGNVNTSLNEGTQTVSLDERWLAFTGCNFPDGYGSCDIYFSYKINSIWSRPANLGTRINTEFWESQPAFSPDKRSLYFAAKLPDGFGGSDLYYSYLDDEGRWSIPRNMGPNINTTADEISPFIHSDNETLYFTSNGWQGYGEMDIFMSSRDEKGEWQIPKNLGYPINTIENESCLFIDSEGKEAFYSSDRGDTKGGLDIYKFKIREDIRPRETFWVKLKIEDRNTRKIIPASINVWDMDYNAISLRPLLLEDTSYLIPFIAGKNYFVSAQNKGYFYNYDVSFRKPNDTPLVYNKKIYLDSFKSSSKLVLKNIYFDFNDFTLKPSSIPELNALLAFLKINDHVKIRVEGHTDNTGSPTHNMNLSYQRAAAVVNFLKNKGIDSSRLDFIGYGIGRPVADNKTEQGKKLNRTEIVIL